METAPTEVLSIILKRLSNWEPGDIRSVTIHIQPWQGKSQVQMTWDDRMIMCCPAALEQCRIPRHTTMAEVKQCIVNAFQAIVNTSGFGKVVITPRRKVGSESDIKHFEVHCIISSHIRVMPFP
jgi:hypothetical protein